MANCTVNQLYLSWMLVAANNVSPVFVPAGGWVSATG